MSVLSARRRQVLRLVANGNTNAAIGRQLGIHRTTVDRHLAEIFKALGACDRANAVAIGLRLGEIDLADVWVPATAAARRSGPTDAPLTPVGVVDGAPEGRTAPRASQRRTGSRGEAAA